LTICMSLNILRTSMIAFPLDQSGHSFCSVLRNERHVFLCATQSSCWHSAEQYGDLHREQNREEVSWQVGKVNIIAWSYPSGEVKPEKSWMLLSGEGFPSGQNDKNWDRYGLNSETQSRRIHSFPDFESIWMFMAVPEIYTRALTWGC